MPGLLSAAEGFFIIGAVIAVGYAAARLRVGGSSAQMVLNKYSFFVCSPCLMFSILSQENLKAIFDPSIVVALLSAAGIAILFLLLNAFLFHMNTPDTTIGVLNSLYLNSNNIGLPIATYILGNPGLVVPILLMQQIFFTPIALMILDASTSDQISLKTIATQPFKQPLLIGSLAGIIVSALSSQAGHFIMPNFMFKPIDMIGSSAVPLILMAFGMSLHGCKPMHKRAERAPTICAVVLKNIIMPILAFFLAYYVMGFRGTELYGCVVLAALPTGQNVYNYAARYEVGTTLARDSILLSTIISPAVIVVIACLLT